MPDGWKFGRVSAVAMDASGNVYVFQRGPKADPIVVFSPEGKYLRSWGKGLFSNPHGIRIDKQGHVWTTDTGFHLVMEFTDDGKLLRTWGTKGKSGATQDTFYRPTDIGFLPNGDFFDGERFRPHPRGGYRRCLRDSVQHIDRLWRTYRVRRPLEVTHAQVQRQHS